MIRQHGNRFARLQDYTASQEALRISLTATDKCISKIRQEKNYAQKDGEVAGHSSQVHEQEMLVVSKQSFHVLSHVCRSVDKFEEASKCLDRIELYINEQRSRDDELYSQTMVQLSGRDRGSTAFHQGSSTFALEGKLGRVWCVFATK
jgi:phage shock protein A